MTTTEHMIREHIVFYGIFITAIHNIVNSCTVFTAYWRFLPYTWKLLMSQCLASSQKLNWWKMAVKLAFHTTTEKLSAVISILESWWQVPGSCFFLCFDQVCNSWENCTVSGFSVTPVYGMGAFDLLLQKSI